jgi:hypothetical protein
MAQTGTEKKKFPCDEMIKRNHMKFEVFRLLKAAGSPEMLVSVYKPTRRYNPEDEHRSK